MPPSQAIAVLALSASLFSGLFLPAGRADDQTERLTPEQRQVLGRKALELLKAGEQAYVRGKLTTAVEETRQSLQFFERLYPKIAYPRGHPDLARSLNNLGAALEAQGDYGGARGYFGRALAMRQALYPVDRFPHGHPELATSLSNLGALLQAHGDYGEARGYIERALAMEQALYPVDLFPHGHPDLAQSLSNLGDLFRAARDYGGARGYYERALAMRQALYPVDRFPHGHPELAQSLNNLGLLLNAIGDHGGARGYYERALAMRQALYPVDRFPHGHPELATSLNNLGSLLQEQGDYGGARGYYERALAMRQALYPKEGYPHGHPTLAASLNNQGALLWAQGDYDGARGYYERARAMYEDLYPEDRFPHGHPDLAQCLNNLGALLRARGDYGGAREYHERALAMRQAFYPEDHFPHGHPDLALSLNNLGALLEAVGDYGGARTYFERALAMRQALYPSGRYPHGHPDLTASLNNLGLLLQAQGDYGGALRYFERALAMNEALNPKDRYPQGHPQLATGLHNLGFLFAAQGDYSSARAYHERALAMRQALYPSGRYPHGHPDLTASLNSLGLLLQAQGDYGGALRYFERALAMNEALYPSGRYRHGHPDLAISLNSLGTLLMTRGEYGGARGYLERALAMDEALYPKDRFPYGHPELARSLNNLGSLLEEQGNYSGARGYLERALAMGQAFYPEDHFPHGHPDLASGLSNLGHLFQAEGRFAAAWPLLQWAVDMYQDGAELFQGAFSEAESQDYMSTLPGTLHGLLSVSCHLTRQVEAMYARVWRNKAAVARVLQHRQAALSLRAGTDADTRRTLDSWRDVRRQIARLILATSNGRDDPGRGQRLRRLTAEKERLERELAAVIPEFAREQALARSPHTRLIEFLPAGTIVLDLVAFNRFEQDPKVRGKKGCRFIFTYVWFVLAKGQPVRQVDLGPAQPIDDAVRAWRSAIMHRQASPAAEVVRRKVWEPLARHFPPRTTTVLVAPDWLLTTVPWGALPGNRSGTVLLEQFALATIPHAPFVLDRLTAPARSRGPGDLVLAVGGVDYDGAPKPLGDPASRTDLLVLRQAATQRGRGPGGDGEGWKGLPGTAREVEAVAKRAAPRPLLRLEGTEASTARLLRELPRARWAHIATHGFFADPKVRSILQPDPRLFVLEGRQRAAGLRNPLVLSGLVLAGANRPSAAVAQANQSADDLGIVTAEAIAGLPLQDLELAVLSACETGLGLVGGGEGAFGLQRAFHLAGAHNVVVSLWKVDDEATAAMMAIFYDHLWRQNKPPIEALRAAQLALYHDPKLAGKLARARGTPDFDKLVRRPEPVAAPGGPEPRRADAKDWAAFVLSGWGR
jgi:tetratricopeptide (TPR) repeat protein/CHAT domain-containing protein